MLLALGWSLAALLVFVVVCALLFQQAAIRRDYEFKGDVLEVPCRLALMFYLHVEFGLDKSRILHAQQLVLENKAELDELQAAAKKMSVISLQSEASARG